MSSFWCFLNERHGSVLLDVISLRFANPRFRGAANCLISLGGRLPIFLTIFWLTSCKAVDRSQDYHRLHLSEPKRNVRVRRKKTNRYDLANCTLLLLLSLFCSMGGDANNIRSCRWRGDFLAGAPLQPLSYTRASPIAEGKLILVTGGLSPFTSCQIEFFPIWRWQP